MIRTRIQHIFKNFNSKPTIYDYMNEPIIVAKKGNIRGAKYVARPVFNSIKVGEDKKAANSFCGYRKYKMKHSKSRMKNVEIMQSNDG